MGQGLVDSCSNLGCSADLVDLIGSELAGPADSVYVGEELTAVNKTKSPCIG
jgi:hypothetical protein